MLDDPVIRTELRKLVQSKEPVTVDLPTLGKLRQVFTALDRSRATVRRLIDRVENCEKRISMLRRIVETQVNESSKRTADLMTAIKERDEALAQRDQAVLDRDNTLRELHTTEEQVAVLIRERDRLAAEVAELKLQQVQAVA